MACRSQCWPSLLRRIVPRSPTAQTALPATHAEYLEAEKHGLRMAVWTSAATDREGHQQADPDFPCRSRIPYGRRPAAAG
jgi:hypothetical protein